MPATNVFKSVGEYLSAAGFPVPCIVIKGYDTNGAVTLVEGSVVTADLLTLNEGTTRLVGVTKGTGAGQFQFGA